MPAKGSGGQAVCCPEKKHYSKGQCRTCYYRAHYAANREYRCARIAENWRKRRLAHWGQAEWGTQCETCGTTGVMSADHSHATGEFRGWLCQPCNMALGLLKDDPRRIEALKSYILRNAAQEIPS